MEYEKWTEEKIATVAVLCKTKQGMKKRFPKEYAAAKRMGLLNHSMFAHMPQRIKVPISSKWGNKEDVLRESAKYPNKKAFFEGNRSCYNAAKYKGWFEEACAQMPKNLCIGKPPTTFKWSREAVKKEALLYNERSDFANGSPGAYDAAIKNGWIDEVCGHMVILVRADLTVEKLKQIFSSCENKKEAREKDPSAYVKVVKNNLQELVFAHMPKRMDLSGENSPFYKKSNDEIRQIALLYNNRISFLTENAAVYQVAYKRGILDEICSHMKKSNDGSSYPEKFIFNLVKNIYPNSKKVRDMKVKIKGKPHIRGFDIDIFVPELNRGIEFDGSYYHSFEGLKKSRPHWPNNDLRNYHKLKDKWFVSKGIEILHIKQKDWKRDKDGCIKKCLDFLNK